MLFGRGRLLVDVGIPSVFIAGEIVGGRLTAKIAIDSLVIGVILSGYVVFVSVFEICHGNFEGGYPFRRGKVDFF